MTSEIKCSRCKHGWCDTSHDIQNTFGYNTSGERYKTCLKCREQGKSQRLSKPKPRPLTEYISNGENYVRCCCCTTACLNTPALIEQYFGQKNNGQRYIKCRNCRKISEIYKQTHATQIAEYSAKYYIEKGRQAREEHSNMLRKQAEESNGTLQYCTRCFKTKPTNEFVYPNGKTYSRCYKCCDWC